MMKLAISNIAWPAEKLDDVLALMERYHATGLEIAPGLLFPNEEDPFLPSDKSIFEIEEKLALKNVSLVSMQSLLFGIQGAEMFGVPAAREVFAQGIERAITLAGRLKIGNLVLGSPKNRIIPESMNADESIDIAINSLRKFGDLAQKVDTHLALEPNPAAYGTNFLNKVKEAFELCERVNHPAITVNFDLGSIHMNNEFQHVSQLYDACAHKVSHIHVSEPNLAPAPQNGKSLEAFIRHLEAAKYDKWVSIEMLCKEGNPVQIIEEKLQTLGSLMNLQPEISGS